MTVHMKILAELSKIYCRRISGEWFTLSGLVRVPRI